MRRGNGAGGAQETVREAGAARRARAADEGTADGLDRRRRRSDGARDREEAREAGRPGEGAPGLRHRRGPRVVRREDSGIRSSSGLRMRLPFGILRARRRRRRDTRGAAGTRSGGRRRRHRGGGGGGGGGGSDARDDPAARGGVAARSQESREGGRRARREGGRRGDGAGEGEDEDDHAGGARGAAAGESGPDGRRRGERVGG
mmetsp:Transcript_3333/g.14540  ORF Transcript_3333/g.14540 Transcript_3333/m.14540 type:complete len:203 (-) Transcript_3333:903-1511(-)